MGPIYFLSKEDILEIHADQLDHYSGQEGVRDEAGLESAVEAPRHWSTYAEHEPGDLIPGIAATYLYTFATSQHFIDGNKRTGAASADVFLQTNGYELSCASDELYETTLRAAEKLVSREFVIEWMRERIVARDPRDNG